ncbi:hypothetical protein GCM10008995_22900 [Halobellus salinus]|uniref:Uncharacterized protein n=1 Tax=Halobellus salinus TaxID=931585 RepID=A0A830ED34_9EURY|nr:hypothetical protein GCM10008995_22900 [Halobellus salinus]
MFRGVEAAVAAGLADHVTHRDDRDAGLAGDGGGFALAATREPDGADDSHYLRIHGSRPYEFRSGALRAADSEPVFLFTRRREDSDEGA